MGREMSIPFYDLTKLAFQYIIYQPDLSPRITYKINHAYENSLISKLDINMSLKKSRSIKKRLKDLTLIRMSEVLFIYKNVCEKILLLDLIRGYFLFFFLFFQAEYKFIYNLVSYYLESLATYSNFQTASIKKK